MNGKDRDRSFSEVGDTLRYFNSMASSHSWCCTDRDDFTLVDLNDWPLGTSAMATATVTAVAVTTAVSCENFEYDNGSAGGEDVNADDHDDGEAICMRDILNNSTTSEASKAIAEDHQRTSLLSPPDRGNQKKCVSILLTAPSENGNDFGHEVGSMPIKSSHAVANTAAAAENKFDLQQFSDPLLNKYALEPNTISPVLRRASDDYRNYASSGSYGRNQLLQVVNVIDNPLLASHEASDGVLALRADRERQRRHSTCPSDSQTPYATGSKSISDNLKGWLQTLSARESRSLEGSMDVGRPRGVEVPEVVVSEHTSSEFADEIFIEDVRIERAHRDLMANTVQKYLILSPSTPLKDKFFTAGLILLTMVGILVLFWYQNWGRGFSAFKKSVYSEDDFDT